ncbi:MAG: hypothetical protein HUU43_07180 [Ignavibacteriaceae bacterium]|nr:hypothetical protein [Ignavibacteriaceae bacterium]
MKFEEFVQKYDYPGSVVLLEGKRDVAEGDKEKLTELGRLLARSTQYMMFRSGNAEGADDLFCTGAAEYAKDRMQLVVPYSGHRKKYIRGIETHSADEIDYAAEPQIAYNATRQNKNNKMIERYLAGHRDRSTIKASYLIRDTIKVTGTGKIGPAAFAIYYDDLKNPESGGTGFTMGVCRSNQVPFIDQRVWMGWLYS